MDIFEEDFNKICKWLNDELGFDETPHFEVNEETIFYLNKTMQAYETRKKEQRIIADQMSQETKEFIADKARMNKMLLSLDLDPQQGLSPKAKKYCSTLCASMEAVGVFRGSLTSIVVALTELLDNINKSAIEVEQLESFCQVLKAQCLKNQELASVLEKQFSNLESSIAAEQKGVEEMRKATKFHSHKKKNYDAKITECEKKLKKCGFSSDLSHVEIIKLGNKASELEKKLKPYLLQLESYKELPADLNLARIKLHEVMNELKEVEDELHQVFQNHERQLRDKLRFLADTLGGSSGLLELDEGNFQLDVSNYVIMLISFCVPNVPACKKLDATLAFASIDLNQHTPRIPIGTVNTANVIEVKQEEDRSPQRISNQYVQSGLSLVDARIVSYEMSNEQLQDSDPMGPCTKEVDCSANKNLCLRYDVTRYPTLKIFRDGSFSEDYDGPVTKKGVAERMIEKFGFASQHVQTMEQFKLILSSDDVIVVGFYPADDPYLMTFMQTSNALLEYNFAHVTSNEIMTSEKTSKVVRLYRPKYLNSVFEPPYVTMKRKPDADNMQQFLAMNALGLCGHITEENMDRFKRPLAIFFLKKLDFVNNAKGANYWRNRAMKVAQEIKGKIRMGIAKLSHLPLILQELNGGETDLMKKETDPLIVIVDEMEKIFVMSDQFSHENFKNFVRSFLEGQAKQYIKSQPIPVTNHGPVKVVVANTFDEIVMDKSKDVFIEFYAPWCGHCKTLESTWNELGRKLLSQDDIVIAKMDATANEIQPGFEVDSYPTLHWVPKNKLNSMQYQGKKTMKAFLKFIEKHSSSKIKVEL